MIGKGVLRNPAVDAMVGIHVSPWLAPGTLGIRHGEMMAAVDRFTLELSGPGGHGAYPHLAADTIVLAARIIDRLQSVVSREIDPLDPVVISVGTIAGGEAFNVIANRVNMTGTVRTLNEKLHRGIGRLIERRIAAMARDAGAQYRFRYEVLGHPLRNDETLLALCRAAGEECLGASRIRVITRPSMGGEDFAEYLRTVPGCFLFLGAATGKRFPWHHERFCLAESAIPRGAALLAHIARKHNGSRD
jgi:amidohydrolase